MPTQLPVLGAAGHDFEQPQPEHFTQLGMIHLLACHPWRPVDSAWQRATGILSGDPAATFRRDGSNYSWIKRAIRVQHALQRAKSDRHRLQVMAEFPELFSAYWLWSQSTADKRTVRWGLEARILARQTDEQIAQANACPPGLVAAYAAMFFDVRSRLNYRDFILCSVVGPQPESGLAGEVDAWLWKLLGYLAGPHVLDAMFGHIPNPIWAHGQNEVSGFYQASAINLIKKKATFASLAIPIEGRTQLQVIESFVKYVKIERTTESPGNASDQIEENLQAMLDSLPFATVGAAGAKQPPDGR